MSKYLYRIMHLPIQRYLKWWLEKFAQSKEVDYNKTFYLGKTEQFSTTGKQLLKLTDGTYNSGNGVTAVVKDNKVTLNGTATSYAVCSIPVIAVSFDNTKSYAFSCQNISGTGTQVSDNNSCYILFAQSNDNTIVQLTPLRTTPTTEVIKNDLSVSMGKLRITSSNGVSYTNYSFELQVEQNSQVTDVEPYTRWNSKPFFNLSTTYYKFRRKFTF